MAVNGEYTLYSLYLCRKTGFKSYQDGIETLSPHLDRFYRQGLNHTKMELKQLAPVTKVAPVTSLNHTKMELKQVLGYYFKDLYRRLNHTKMELKLYNN